MSRIEAERRKDELNLSFAFAAASNASLSIESQIDSAGKSEAEIAPRKH